MSGDALHVRRLRVHSRVPLASAVGMSARIEDALRTSSRPSIWRGRVILVRRLQLRVREHAPAHVMARVIEREWQRVERSAVEYRHASPTAEAVWFAGQIEARLALMARLATDADVSAWFWRRLLPLEAPASREEQLTALFAARWVDLTVAGDEQMRFARMAFATLGAKARAARIVAALGEADLGRLVPLLADTESLPLSRVVRATANAGSEDAALDDTLMNVGPIARESLRAKVLRFAVSSIGSVGPVSPQWAEPRGAEATTAWPESASAVTSALSEGVVSRWAGLFFVLHLLERTGAPPGSPHETVAILYAVAEWLRVRSDDPVYESLALFSDEMPRRDVPLEKVRALRVACLRMTRRPLRRIVARSGRMLITRTHVTVIFDLNSVRLDVRKAGLDLDPGWLPRLGRVVRFEYE